MGDTAEIRSIVAQILGSAEMQALLKGMAEGQTAAGAPEFAGVFRTVDEAVTAAAAAQRELQRLSLDGRRKIVEAIRTAVLRENASLSAEAVAETGLGNARDKCAKNLLAATKTPGVEDIEQAAYTDEHGLTLVERAPWGVIGAITPVTNPVATITCNAIGMIAAGNAVVFNVHPGAKGISNRLIGMLNRAIIEAGGPKNLLCGIAVPTIESAGDLMKHPGIGLLVVTGGPGVVKAAMASGKKAICAGPGNPPCVVDETADIAKAGRAIVAGASFDNNVVCVCEKEVLAVEAIADRLKAELRLNGAYELTGAQIEAVTAVALSKDAPSGASTPPNKEMVGKDAAVIARAAGIEVPQGTRLLLMEVGADHPMVWSEQLMPVLPLVRMKNVDEAIDFAVKVEHGFRHSAMMHSHDVVNLTKMAQAMNCSIFVKNGPCYAGLGNGGAGFTSFTIASPTGEGITRARTFTRERRCALVDSFRIV